VPLPVLGLRLALVSDITLKSSQVKSCVTDEHNTKYNTLINEQPLYPCPVVNFHISGTKWASPGTRDTVGQFRDDPGHSGTVGKPILRWWSSFTFTFRLTYPLQMNL